IFGRGIEETWAVCLQFRAHVVRNVANGLVDRSDPQNESVPFDVLIRACGQFTPGHKQSTLQGSLFTVESNVVNEAVEVPSSHPQSVFWGRLPKLSVGVPLLYQFPFVQESAQHATNGKVGNVARLKNGLSAVVCAPAQVRPRCDISLTSAMHSGSDA